MFDCTKSVIVTVTVPVYKWNAVEMHLYSANHLTQLLWKHTIDHRFFLWIDCGAPDKMGSQGSLIDDFSLFFNEKEHFGPSHLDGTDAGSYQVLGLYIFI